MALNDENVYCRICNLEIGEDALCKIDADIMSDLSYCMIEQLKARFSILLNKVYKEQLNRLSRAFEQEYGDNIKVSLIGCHSPISDAVRDRNTIVFDISMDAHMVENIITNENIMVGVLLRLTREMFPQETNGRDLYAFCNIKR